MGVWPDVATAVSDLRAYLNDGPTDRPIKSKQVVGVVNGTNVNFMTFEDRIIETSLVVTVDYSDVADNDVVVDDASMGRFHLRTAPIAGQVVRAHYYFQFFLDGELREAVQLATGEVLNTEDVGGIPIGLKTATLNFGGYFAFNKQAIRWATRMSNRFLLEEEPLEQETNNRANHFKTLAKNYFDEARIMRDDYYKRHSRGLAPAAGMLKANIPPIAPRR